MQSPIDFPLDERSLLSSPLYLAWLQCHHHWPLRPLFTRFFLLHCSERPTKLSFLMNLALSCCSYVIRASYLFRAIMTAIHFLLKSVLARCDQSHLYASFCLAYVSISPFPLVSLSRSIHHELREAHRLTLLFLNRSETRYS